MSQGVRTIGLIFSNPADRQLLVEFLTERGYGVRASAPAQADPAGWDGVDLVLADGPGAQRWKEDLLALKARSPAVFLPLLVALPHGTEAGPWLQAGFDDVLRMPITRAELAARLEMFLRLREQSEELARRGEAMFRALVEQSLVGVYLILEGRFAYVNDALAQMFGYQPEEIIGHLGPLDLTHPDDHRQVLENIRRVSSEAESARYTFRGRCKDGRVIHCEVYGKRIDYQGQVAILGTLVDLTERLQAQEAYQVLVEHSLQGLLIIQDSRVVFANPAIAAISGYSIEELLAFSPQQLAECVHPEDREWVVRRMEDRQAGRPVPSRYAFRLVRKDGDVRWVEIMASAVEYRGRPVIQVAYVDVTGEMEAEQARRESQERYRLLLESISDSVYVLDRQWRHVVVNEAAERFTHIPKERLLGGKLTDLFPGVEHTPFFQTFQRVMETRQPDVVVAEFSFENGRRGWYEVHVYPAPEGILCISTDITARVQAEQSAQERQQELVLLNQLGRALAETLDLSRIGQIAYQYVSQLVDCSAAFGISLYDPQTRTLRTEWMLGDGEPLDVAQFPPLRMDVEPTRGRARAIATAQPEVVRNMVAAVAEAGEAVVIGRPENGQVAQSALYIPMVVQGQVTGLLELQSYQPDAYSQERVRVLGPVANQIGLAIENARLFAQVQEYAAGLEERVHERTARLQEANEELEAFAYSVSHDLRAPLRAMEGFAQALLEDHAEQMEPQAQDYARRIFEAAQRMDSLILDLLAYSRVSRMEMRRGPVKLETALQEALTDLAAEIAQKGAQVTVEEPLPRVLAHRSVLIQVLENLLSNAVKFVASGVQPCVRVWAQPRGDRVRLWVEDNGIGIAPEDQERIFRVFERLHGIEAYPGTGIGLAIVRKGVERMGGQVGVESEVGQGSRFWIELERVRDDR